MGVFALVLLILLLSVVFYFILRCIDRKSKGKTIAKLRKKLSEKLFYNGFLRYMTVSNLKLNYTLWGFMIFYYSFADI